MRISAVTGNKYQIPSFGAAIVNVNAFSDTHGELRLANNALEEMRSRQQDIFCRENKGRLNVLAICGDWFMDGAKRGYTSNPEKKNAEFQLDILNEFINQIKGMAGAETTTLFTAGNHEFDGGVELLDEILSKIDAEVLMTNLDIENSPAFEKSISGDKIINKKIVEADDDKDPDLKHKLMFLGVCPVNMHAYQRNTEGLTFLDNIDKPQRYVKKEDYKTTFDECKRRIAEFKSENPDGIVIFLSHTGVQFADNLAKESTVDLIFDGHEHEDLMRMVNNTPIVPLSQNFKKIVNAEININDNGKLEKININPFSPLKNETKGPLSKLYYSLFKDDAKKKYQIKTDVKDLKTLDVKDVRGKNNFLANFVTDSILSELQKQDSSIDFFALNSSSIRHSLNISHNEKSSVSDLDVMNVLAGISINDGAVMITELTGRDIVYIVLDNFLFNQDKPQQNSLIHYSGLITDRTRMLEDYQKGKSLDELAKYVTDTRTGMPLEVDKKYKIANAEKYFNKSSNPVIKSMKEQSEYTGDTVQELFKRHFEKSDGVLYAKCDVRIK